MKIGLVTSSVSQSAGGVVEVIRPLANELASLGMDISILSLRDNSSEVDLSDWSPISPLTFPGIGPSTFGFSPSLSRALIESGVNLLHVHGLWMYPSLACLYWAFKSAQPYIVSPHGMLHPKALEISWWKKKPVAWVYENYHLKHARCLHATSESEAYFIRKYGIKTPICIIPNGIHLPRLNKRPSGDQRSDKKVLLYLGRLHPQKGLLTLLRAWEAVQRSRVPEAKDWCLVIAGWDQNGHEGELKSFSQKQSILDSVCFVGPQFGAMKDRIYRSADAFVLPSSFESFGMVVLEAWSYGLPVLMTNQGYLSEGFTSDAALPMEFSFEGMVDGLHTLCSMSDQQRQDMGRRGLDLVERQFTWTRNATSMRSVYEWILGEGPRPNCVV